MKKTIIIILFFLNLSVKSQNKIVPKDINLDPEEYVEDIKMYSSNFYVAGSKMSKILNSDGYSRNSFLNKYDKNLKLLWNTKLNLKDESSIVRKLEVFNNKIYALVQHGEETNSTTDTSINLYIISMDGKVIEKTKVGNCYSSPTNILIEKNKLWFAYSEPSSINNSPSNIIKPVLVEYDLKTKQITKKKGANSTCFPQKIISANSEIYVFGRFIKDLVFEHFVLKFEKNDPIEQILHTEKSEYFLDAYESDKELIVLTTFPGVYGDSNQYLKYSYVNAKNNSIREKIIYYKDKNWSDIKFETYHENQTTWLITVHNNSNEFYTQINKKGEVISEISLKKIGDNIHSFIIQQNYQFQNDWHKLKITNEIRNLN